MATRIRVDVAFENDAKGRKWGQFCRIEARNILCRQEELHLCRVCFILFLSVSVEARFEAQ